MGEVLYLDPSDNVLRWAGPQTGSSLLTQLLSALTALGPIPRTLFLLLQN